MNVYPQDDTVTQNQSQLETLSRTLKLSGGEFSLLLVRCNYTNLREKIVKQLHQKSTLPIREIHLSGCIDNLYRKIETELLEEQPAVVMVFGLEGVQVIDEVLAATNLAREAFLNFSFPLVLWINDNLWKKLNRRAPDFTGYATTYVFLQSSAELIQFLHQKSQHLFQRILDIGCCSFIPNRKILGTNSSSELELAYQDLQSRHITLKPALTASLRFVVARYYYAHQNISAALEQYQLSLRFWQEEHAQIISHSTAVETEYPLINSSSTVTSLIWQGVILYHLGLCLAYQAEQHLRHTGREEWQQARLYMEQGLDYFETAQRQDLVAKFINQLGEILRQLGDWDALFKLALKSRQLHQEENSQPLQLAQDYGFLAEYYLHKGDWENSQEFAKVALEIIRQSPSETPDYPVKNQNQGLYYWILAQALEQLNQTEEAIDKLEIAYKETTPKYNPRFYLQILGMLHRLYFERGEYREAFDIKKEYRTKSSAFGYTAFIGAGRLQPREQAVDPMLGTVSTPNTVTDEIKASGREEAINHLLQRVGSTQDKLTVIYGQSGVGKSSIIRAGLVPALQDFSVEARLVVPIVVRTYNLFVQELENQLYNDPFNSSLDVEQSTDESEDEQDSTQNTNRNHQETIENILLKLRENANQNKITVLIFDQFEEFFFVHPRSKCRVFFELFRDCLNLPYVKVMISIRDDYLHCLLEGVRAINFDIINNDILNKDILFYLGNLSHKEAYNVIKSLTDRSHFFLEDELIQALVNDLSSELGEVRPIELQVVGSQLQAEDITTLIDYRNKGPKQKLVERFLEEVIQDCGSENQHASNVILYLLTDENNTRPLKTRSEITEELKEELGKDAVDSQLDLILYILAQSGLVSREIVDGTEFYQLVHDYLADFIRQKHRLDRDAEFEQLQQRNKELKEDVDIYSRFAKETERRRKAEQRSRQLGWIMVVLAGIFLTGFLLLTARQNRQAQRAKIDAIKTAKDSLIVVNQNDQIGILRSIIATSQSIQRLQQASKEEENMIATGFRKLFDNSLHERNRLEQKDSVLAATYSPDGELIATAGNEKLIKLWRADGKFIANLVDQTLNSEQLSHQGNVISLSFSPNGELIASGSVDNTIKLWSRDGEWLKTLIGHQDVVTSVIFSPEGETIASASADGTVKVWDVETGTEIETINAHQGGVLDVKFSPDGEIIASGGTFDPTVKLWKPDGTRLKTLRGHCQSFNQTEECIGVYELSFSPNGKILASASGDRTLKLWDVQTGKEIETLKGHNNDVLGVSFSPDGQTIASSSRDRTVKLWNQKGVILQTFTGHNNDVWTVSFSPDSQIIASASSDNTVKLWDRNRNPLDQILQGHSLAINDISFSPNGLIATASNDRTVRLWKTNTAEPLKNSEDQPLVLPHQKEVRWVSWSPDGKTLATVSFQEPTIKLWTAGGELINTLTGHDSTVNAVEFSSTGMIASGTQDGIVKLWQPDGTLIETLNLNAAIVSLRFDQTGDSMAIATWDPTTGLSQLQLWKSQEIGWQSQIIRSYPNQMINEISYTPIEEVLAIAIDDYVELWSPSQKESCRLQHQATVRSVNFHPNGTILAAASDDKKVRLWQLNREQLWPKNENSQTEDNKDCQTQEIEPFYIIDQDVFLNRIQVNPDGNILAIAKEDGTTLLWNLQGFQLDYQTQQGCLWLQDYLSNLPDHKPTSLCQELVNSQ